VFIINLIPLHVFVLLLMGRFSSRIYVGELRLPRDHINTSSINLVFKAYLAYLHDV